MIVLKFKLFWTVGCKMSLLMCWCNI